MKKVSIVILNWNGEKLLEQFLPSVIANSDIENTEIVVADNNSTDNSVEFIKSTYPKVRIISLTENFGYAQGYNEALKQVDAEYIVLLNSDVEVTSNWLTPMIDFLDSNDTVAALQPKILSFKDKDSFEYAGASGGFIDKYGYPFCRGRIFDAVEKDYKQYDSTIDVFWASGACLVIRKKDFDDAGGFDSSFFAHMEEIDLCWRLNSRGRRIICFPQSTVYHVGGATLSENSPRKTYLNFRNNLIMLYKNLPDNKLVKVLVVRRALDYIAAGKLLLSGKRKNAKAILEAYKEANKILSSYENKRKDNLLKTKVDNIKTIYPKSILKTYYLNGLKSFDRLKF